MPPSSPVTEHRVAGEATLSCSLLTPEHCRHTVKWLHRGGDVDERDVKTSRSACSVTVTLPSSRRRQQPTYPEWFKCEVKDKDSGRLQLFTFSPQAAGETVAQCRLQL